MVVDYVGKSLSQRLPAGQVTCTFLDCGRDQILGNGNLEYQQLHNERKYCVNYYTFCYNEMFIHLPRNTENQFRRLALFCINAENIISHGFHMLTHYKILGKKS
jgi:hypothetical protein